MDDVKQTDLTEDSNNEYEKCNALIEQIKLLYLVYTGIDLMGIKINVVDKDKLTEDDASAYAKTTVDGDFEIYIRKSSIRGDFRCVLDVFHELAHVSDAIKYCELNGIKKGEFEFAYETPFSYWTEMNAYYLSYSMYCYFMIKNINCEKEQMIEYLENSIENTRNAMEKEYHGEDAHLHHVLYSASEAYGKFKAIAFLKEDSENKIPDKFILDYRFWLLYSFMETYPKLEQANSRWRHLEKIMNYFTNPPTN